MADQIAIAEEKLRGWGLFGSNKYEDASELFSKSANHLKLAKIFTGDRADSVFIKLSDCYFKVDSKHEAAMAYVNAANRYKRVSNRGHLLNAGLCQLCKGDFVAVTNALEKYEDSDPTFSRTREYRFLADLASAIDEEDVAKFTSVVKEFDSITSLDPWKTSLLLRVKEALKAKELEDDELV